MTGIYLPPNVGLRRFNFDDEFAAREQLLRTIAEQSLSGDIGLFLLNLAKSQVRNVHDLFSSEWHKEDIGVILIRIGHALGPDDAPAVEDPDELLLRGAFSEMGFGLLRRWMSNALLQALPPESLPEFLVEQRLQLDMGL
jgi:hypothetical protein